MEPINVRVRGSHTSSYPAERGTVHCEISLQGPDPVEVMRAVTASLRDVVASVQDLHDKRSGPITWYSVDQVSTRAWIPRDRNGNDMAEVHQSSVSLEVKFSDFDELSSWVTAGSEVLGFSVGWVDWTLTSKKREAVEVKARQRAVRDARKRAQDYADALDLGQVQVRAISDPGLGFPALTQNGPDRHLELLGSVGGAEDATSSGERVLVPKNIEVGASVDAEFVLAS
ncbi:uncharacterized protein YggE [Marmoricola sp. OAE513]|uniref:SIMPL domain-containing protein n=1 Tax=Marmoricola sp. OAE513 TaxID=2817894 RepID=UPI001AEB5FF5